MTGDANLDGSVNASDLNDLGQNWLDRPNVWSNGDFNADGTVDAGDLNKIGLMWQQSIPLAASPESVPEPAVTTLAIFALADLPCLRRRTLGTIRVA